MCLSACPGAQTGMQPVEAEMERPSLITRVGQEHLHVCFFSLGKVGKGPLAAALTALVIGIALALPAGLYVLTRNLATVGYSWQESLQISLFLKDRDQHEQGDGMARQQRARQEERRGGKE